MEERRQEHLKARAMRVGHGGVGPGPSDVPSTRAKGWTRLAVLTLAVVCLGAGFTSSRVWDSRNADRLQLEQAAEVMRDTNRDTMTRTAALLGLYGLASQAMRELAEASADPAIGDKARLYLRHLNNQAPKQR